MKFTVVVAWCDYDGGGVRHEVVEASSPEEAATSRFRDLSDGHTILVFAGEPVDMTSEVERLAEEEIRRQKAEQEARAKAKAEAKERTLYEKLHAKFGK